MAYVHIHILIVLVLFCRPLWAQDKAYALVRSIQGIETLPPSLARQLEKVSLQVVAKQPGYELLLSGTDTPKGAVVEMVAVEPEVSRKGDSFRVEARLIDVKTKRLLARASRDHIREEDVVRLFQGAMEAIFMGHHSEGELEEKENAKPKDRPKVPSTTQTNTPDEPSIDFRKRIADLKVGVDKKIVDVVETKEEAAKKKENEAALMKSSKNGMALEADASKKPTNSKIYQKIHVLSLAFDSRTITSVGLLDATSKATTASVRASGHAPTSLFDGKTAYSWDFAYSMVQGIEYEVPSVYQAGLYGSWLSENWFLSIGLFRDATFFVNLPVPGEGLQASSLTSTWTRVKTEITLPFSRPWKIAASYGKPYSVESNYKPISAAEEWQGTHMHLGISPHFVLLGFETNLTFETLDLSTQGEIPFTFNESRLGLSLRRSL